MNEYIKQAKDFLKATDAQIDMQQIRPNLAFRPNWATEDSIQHGFEYRVALSRGDKDYRFSFWDSISNAQSNKRPTVYDILACLSGSIYCPETFEEFVNAYCEDISTVAAYKNAKQAYNGIKEESKALHNLFTEAELEQLGEIN